MGHLGTFCLMLGTGRPIRQEERRTGFQRRPDRMTILLGLAAAMLMPAGSEAQQRPGIQSLNPDISVIGDFIADLSPEVPRFNEDGARFAMREVELGLQAAVDPFFRADFFLGIHGGEIDVEEAYLTALALPGELQARVGRFHLPFGKVNLTHRPELTSVEYPLVIRTWFSPEGYTGTGLTASRIFAPFGFFQELQLFILNGIEGDAHHHDHGHEEAGHDHVVEPDHAVEPVVGGPHRSGTEQFALFLHLRNFVDLTPAANLEVGLSGGAGTVERYGLPEGGLGDPAGIGDAPDLLRTYPTQLLYGANVIYRWRPPARGLYRSFRWELESFGMDGPEARVWGGFTQLQWQTGRRTYVGGRIDAVQLPGGQTVDVHGEGAGRHVHLHRDEGGAWRHAASATLTFFPSEFSRFRLGVERTYGDGWDGSSHWRAALQTTFALGPHRPHPF